MNGPCDWGVGSGCDLYLPRRRRNARIEAAVAAMFGIADQTGESVDVIRQFTDAEVRALAGQAATLDWFRANGIDPNVVALEPFSIERDNDGSEIIRYRAFVLTVDGHKQVDLNDRHQAWIEESTTPLLKPLPKAIAAAIGHTP